MGKLCAQVANWRAVQLIAKLLPKIPTGDKSLSPRAGEISAGEWREGIALVLKLSSGKVGCSLPPRIMGKLLRVLCNAMNARLFLARAGRRRRRRCRRQCDRFSLAGKEFDVSAPLHENASFLCGHCRSIDRDYRQIYWNLGTSWGSSFDVCSTPGWIKSLIAMNFPL